MNANQIKKARAMRKLGLDDEAIARALNVDTAAVASTLAKGPVDDDAPAPKRKASKPRRASAPATVRAPEPSEFHKQWHSERFGGASSTNLGHGFAVVRGGIGTRRI
jgi:hypothetical protein